jgi:dienelactone hydrolase
MMSKPMMRGGLVALALVLAGHIAAPSGQAPAPPSYKTLFYARDGLRLESYLYLPSRPGPAPLVLYNHGSRAGAERTERPFPWIARFLTAAGYAVLVPERRGYGKSEGPTFTEEVGVDRGPRFMARLQAETDDALAALASAQEEDHASIDVRHVAIMGWSFGGIVSVLGAARGEKFMAVVIQAPGALNWDRSPALREALLDAARRIRVPVQCMVAENDATTESAKQICAKAKAAGAATSLTVYPAFNPRQPSDTAPGHLLFGADGVGLWEKDVLAFLGTAVRP